MKTKVTGYLTQKHGFYYVVLNLPTDEKGKRNRKTLSTGLSTDRNATKAKALLLTMIREANAGEEVRGVNERQPKSQNKTEDERYRLFQLRGVQAHLVAAAFYVRLGMAAVII